jgi:hypothetical protein
MVASNALQAAEAKALPIPGASALGSEALCIVQVLISIQSMILVDDPYFNEPGYESSRGSAHGKSANDAYNRQQQHNTLRYAILPALKHPDPCFADVIKYELAAAMCMHAPSSS